MSEQPGAIIVDGVGTVSEYQLGQHVGGTKLARQVEVLSNTVASGLRTVVMTRTFAGATPAQYTFKVNNDGSQLIQFMNAVGSGPLYSFHKTMSSSTVLVASKSQIIICNTVLRTNSASKPRCPEQPEAYNFTLIINNKSQIIMSLPFFKMAPKSRMKRFKPHFIID